MFSLQFYPSPEYFTRPLVAMVGTFCMSGSSPYIAIAKKFIRMDHRNKNKKLKVLNKIKVDKGQVGIIESG